MKTIVVYRRISGVEMEVCSISSKNTVDKSVIMGAYEVQVSVTVDTELDIKERDYVKLDGINYTLNRDAEYTKESDVKYSYDLVFEHPFYVLLNKMYCNRITGDTTFTLIGKLRDFVELLVWCINITSENPDGVDTGWTIGEIIDTDYKNLTFSDLDGKEVLDKLADEFQAEYYFNNKQFNFVERIERITDYVFEQGAGKGLYRLTQQNVDKEDTVTRLIVRGGNQNIPNAYADNEGYLKLPENYLEDFTEHSKVVEKKKKFEEEFPKFVGTIAAVSGTNNKILTCPQIDFDVAAIAVGDNARINFLSGDLTGVSFKFDWQNSNKQITLIEQEDETALPDAEGEKPTIPSDSKKAKIGDTFNFTGVLMPESYVSASITRLREKGNKYLNFFSRKRVKYSLDIDHRYLRNKPELKVGDLVVISIPEKSFYQAIRITELEKNLYTGAISATVSNYLSESWEKYVQKQVDAVTNQIVAGHKVKNGVDGQSGLGIIFTNPSVAVRCNAAGTVLSYENTGNEIYVYEGDEKLKFTTGSLANGQFKVEFMQAGWITTGTISLGNPSGGLGEFCRVGIASNMTGDTAIIDYRIYGKKNNGNDFEIKYYRQVFNKVRHGTDGLDAYSPYIGANGNWWVWSDAQQKYVDSGGTAQGYDGKSPYIGANGNWYFWNGTAWVDTGIKARGEDGDDGLDAPLLYLSATAEAMTFNADDTPNPALQTITIEAKLQNVVGVASFSAIPYVGSTAQPAITLGGTGNTRTLVQSQWAANVDRVVITATLGSLSDVVTIVKLKQGKDGQDPVVGYLTNENATLPASSTGVVSDFSNANGQFKVYEGLIDKTSQAVFIKVSNTGCTATISSSGAYSVSAMSADSAVAVFRAEYKGVVIDRPLTLSKSKKGDKGDSFIFRYKRSETKPLPPETGDLNPVGWMAEVDSPDNLPVYGFRVVDGDWSLVSGEYKSKSISHNQNSFFKIGFFTAEDNVTVKVNVRVSSEANDRLYVGKINEELGTNNANAHTNISGTVAYIQTYTAVKAGFHFIEFRYVKNASVSSGSDAGFIALDIPAKKVWMTSCQVVGEVASAWSDPVLFIDYGLTEAAYLTKALQQTTDIFGGLVLASVMGVRDINGAVRAYMNGDPLLNDIAFAAGVEHFGTIAETQKAVIYHDGRSKFTDTEIEGKVVATEGSFSGRISQPFVWSIGFEKSFSVVSTLASSVPLPVDTSLNGAVIRVYSHNRANTGVHIADGRAFLQTTKTQIDIQADRYREFLCVCAGTNFIGWLPLPSPDDFGLLLSATVNSGGGWFDVWGSKQSSTPPPLPSTTGRYTIYHTVGHTKYQVSCISNTANRSFSIYAKNTNSVVVECRTIGSSPALVNATFDIILSGNNYIT